MGKFTRLERIMIAFILITWMSFLATLMAHYVQIPEWPFDKWLIWIPPIITWIFFLISVIFILIRILKPYRESKRKLEAILAQKKMISQNLSVSLRKPEIKMLEFEDSTEPKKVREAELQPSIATCMICKLEIRRRQSTKKCPFCKSLFHKNHLLNWFKEHNDCPVCNQVIR